MFPALYTLATSCTQHGVRQSCAFTLHVGSGSVFCSSKKNQASRFNFMDTDNVQNEAQRKEGWKHLEDLHQGSILRSSLPLSYLVVFLFSCPCSLGKSLDEHVFSYVAVG
jgi:hypothetical protein